eukprot:TRINITY_DN4982_c0_g1_i2.p1 TRINITY_DN4982_c0_g1~~TRINITY_DN4982_c0_g1_i2.p1  ORF type:complete len:268 (-),score=39.75 TRINITY_DN4982_c0_g1_i2:403-1206(-)
MDKVIEKLKEAQSNIHLPDFGKIFNQDPQKQLPKRDDEANRMLSMGVNYSQEQKGSKNRLKPIHQLWYIEDNMTLVPMICYASRDAPETSVVMSKRDGRGNQVWCVPSTGNYALSNMPPVEGRECTPLAGGLAWQVNLGDRPKRRIFRKLIITGTTMAIGAGILKGIQYVNNHDGFKGQFDRIRQHFQSQPVATAQVSADDVFPPPIENYQPETSLSSPPTQQFQPPSIEQFLPESSYYQVPSPSIQTEPTTKMGFGTDFFPDNSSL